MFYPGDIFEFVDRSRASLWFARQLNDIEIGEWFVVISPNSDHQISTTNIRIILKGIPQMPFAWRFKLLAKKTKFGYIIME